MDKAGVDNPSSSGPDPSGGARVTSSEKAPMCYYCSSTDTMEPYTRTAHIPFVSRVFPRIRLRYCRICTRHFLILLPDRSR